MPFCQRDSGSSSSSSSSSYVVAGLLKRLELERTSAHCRAKVKKLVTCAARSWSTSQYDAYQKLVNNIQP
jgi:IS1 family transposase